MTSSTLHNSMVVVMGSISWNKSPQDKTISKMLKENCTERANVNILEGIRFYVSFACSFAFSELKPWRDQQRSSH